MITAYSLGTEVALIKFCFTKDFLTFFHLMSINRLAKDSIPMVDRNFRLTEVNLLVESVEFCT